MLPEPRTPERRSLLSSIEVDGLWGHKNLAIQFRPDVNILIGQNGSGKTTILNIVADILLMDFVALSKIRFDRVRLVFYNPASETHPTIIVEKLRSNAESVDEGMSVLAFANLGDAVAAAEQHVNFAYSGALIRRNTLSGLLGLGDQTVEPVRPALASFISELAAPTWISVHRKIATSSSDMKGNFDSAVDERLEQINARFTEYVNAIDNRQTARTTAFQKHLLTNLMLTLPTTELNAKRLARIDILRLRRTIQRIFRELELAIPQQRFIEVFNKAGGALERVKQHEAMDTGDQLIASYLLQMDRIALIWAKYSNEIQELRHKRHAITFALDEFFEGKEAYIAAGGRIFFERDGGDVSPPQRIYPQNLSSGEKQIYILLMETLLASGRPSIFIADEPELSLHVLWQEKLINEMIKLNQDAQLIFATHSPDLVGAFSHAVHDMDKPQMSSPGKVG